MAAEQTRWAGVDVGARKGFDVAALDASGLVAGPDRIVDVSDVVAWLADQHPAVVAVDSPRGPAPHRALSRETERALVAARVCGIRYTPDQASLAANPTYYAWITHGFELYDALLAVAPATRWRIVECFPTATWSRLGGPKGSRSRASWSRNVLASLGLERLPIRMNQDARDAVGAAITARMYDEGKTESFGDIVVPVSWRG